MLEPPQPKWIVTGGALGLTVLLLLLDSYVDPALNFSIFYLAPLALLAWYVSGPASLVLAVAAVTSWLVGERWQQPAASLSYVLFWNAGVRLGSFLVFIVVLVQLRRRLQQAERLATTDSLTQLVNRFAFYALVENEIRRSHHLGQPLTLAYLDLDNFKTVNDRWGHLTGDEVLRSVAETLQTGVRSFDVVARLGGDEFAVMLPNTPQATAQRVLERLHTRVLSAMNDQNWPVTASLGVVTFVSPPHSLTQMLRLADELMYTVKRNGKNQVQHIAVE